MGLFRRTNVAHLATLRFSSQPLRSSFVSPCRILPSSPKVRCSRFSLTQMHVCSSTALRLLQNREVGVRTTITLLCETFYTLLLKTS
jgi:hypothetical protein